MTDDRVRQASEEQLERLLRGLLEDEHEGGPRGMVAEAAVPVEILEMRDMARRVRAASQWTPLPEGRLAVRRALVATAEQHEQERKGAGRPAWGWWRSRGVGMLAAAAAVVVVVFGLGAGMLDGLIPPSSPMYGVRLQLDEVRVAMVPTPAGKAELLLRAAQDRLLEIDAMAALGNVEGMKRAAEALDSDAKRLHEIVVTLPAAQRHRFEAALGVDQ